MDGETRVRREGSEGGESGLAFGYVAAPDDGVVLSIGGEDLGGVVCIRCRCWRLGGS
jgi:hypothetical protein